VLRELREDRGVPGITVLELRQHPEHRAKLLEQGFFSVDWQ
jgi:hypothetical protein